MRLDLLIGPDRLQHLPPGSVSGGLVVRFEGHSGLVRLRSEPASSWTNASAERAVAALTEIHFRLTGSVALSLLIEEESVGQAKAKSLSREGYLKYLRERAEDTEESSERRAQWAALAEEWEQHIEPPDSSVGQEPLF